MIDEGTPDKVKEVLRLYYIRYSGPGGMTEQDDMENWNYAHNASKGVMRPPDALQLPDGHRPYSGRHRTPGVVTERICEENARGFCRRWAAMMDAKSWDDLAPTGKAGSNGNGRSHTR